MARAMRKSTVQGDKIATYQPLGNDLIATIRQASELVEVASYTGLSLAELKDAAQSASDVLGEIHSKVNRLRKVELNISTIRFEINDRYKKDCKNGSNNDCAFVYIEFKDGRYDMRKSLRPSDIKGSTKDIEARLEKFVKLHNKDPKIAEFLYERSKQILNVVDTTKVEAAYKAILALDERAEEQQVVASEFKEYAYTKVSKPFFDEYFDKLTALKGDKVESSYEKTANTYKGAVKYLTSLFSPKTPAPDQEIEEPKESDSIKFPDINAQYQTLADIAATIGKGYCYTVAKSAPAASFGQIASICTALYPMETELDDHIQGLLVSSITEINAPSKPSPNAYPSVGDGGESSGQKLIGAPADQEESHHVVDEL